MAWADLKLGVHLNMRAFRTFIASVLGYIIQLERPSDAVCKGWNWSLRRLVPGPGNWITESDLTALSFLHISPCEFPTLESWSLASRVRVLFSLGMNGTIEKLVALEKMALRHFTDPRTKRWFDVSPASVLLEAFRTMEARKIRTQNICSLAAHPLHRDDPKAAGKIKSNFQRRAAQLFYARGPKFVSSESKVRNKLEKWSLHTPPGVAGRRLCARWSLCSPLLMPCAMIAHFKLVWNGWVTTRRMDHVTAPCVFGCPRGEDSAQHYTVCNVLWKFLHTPLPAGAGIPEDCRPSADSIFLLSGNYPTEQNARIAMHHYFRRP